MKLTLIFSILTLTSSAQWNYKVGLVAPIPFYVETNYTVDVSSALGTVSYTKGKWDLKATTGYLRFRNNQPWLGNVQNIPLLIGGSYHVSPSFYVGVQAGPSIFTELRVDDTDIKWLYSPHIGWHQKRWSVDMNYLNWEEVDDAVNSLVLVISYNLKK
jgi:hypothetical protein